MENKQDSMYYKGYLAGYRDGLTAAARGKRPDINKEITELPIEAMALSPRARNCLTRAGCTYVSDVIALSENTIATMRNLGRKSASEIARWLDPNGICYSQWSKYL